MKTASARAGDMGQIRRVGGVSVPLPNGLDDLFNLRRAFGIAAFALIVIE
ncbi:hypothetical protein J2735_000685 [Agrobacterium tumefaciens]|jgi:hypothetical protein|nr:hypothetical protein [Agrobacterium tumefaciens]MDR6587550.1 hypothetical protein [Agrobacterium tumefaciens]